MDDNQNQQSGQEVSSASPPPPEPPKDLFTDKPFEEVTKGIKH